MRATAELFPKVPKEIRKGGVLDYLTEKTGGAFTKVVDAIKALNEAIDEVARKPLTWAKNADEAGTHVVHGAWSLLMGGGIILFGGTSLLALANIWSNLLQKHVGYTGALHITSEVGQNLFQSTKGILIGNQFTREGLVPIVNSQWSFDLLPTEKKTGLAAIIEKKRAEKQGTILRRNVNELSQIENYLVTCEIPNFLKKLGEAEGLQKELMQEYKVKPTLANYKRLIETNELINFCKQRILFDEAILEEKFGHKKRIIFLNTNSNSIENLSAVLKDEDIIKGKDKRK